MNEIPFNEIEAAFSSSGVSAGLESFIAVLRNGPDRHALFRALLLKKRHELGLPLVNPGDMDGVPEEIRHAYEEYVEQCCKEAGALCLNDGNIPLAWRYFRTISLKEPVRQALEKLDPKSATDEIIHIALDEGAAPVRGFEMVLERDGLCRGISVFNAGFTDSLPVKRRAAELLCRALYGDLVLAVRREIHERFNEFPPETDLVDLIRHRPWLFEKGNTHADPMHVMAVARIGVLAESQPARLMALSISEYGRMLAAEHCGAGRAPFEAGFDDTARYVRALLGENVESAITHFRAKLDQYGPPGEDSFPAEMVLLLLWRCGRKEEALALWQKYLGYQPPEAPGQFIPSFYDLCAEAGAFQKLAETARQQHDLSAWAAALAMEKAGS